MHGPGTIAGGAVLVQMDPDAAEAANNVGFWPLHEACCAIRCGALFGGAEPLCFQAGITMALGTWIGGTA
jgi:hypothetical protein